MFLEYHPDMLPALTGLYARYASHAPGLAPFPPEHWEAIFTRPDSDPRRDVVIAARPGLPESVEPAGLAGLAGLAGFCWLYVRSATAPIILRGPYLSPDDPDCKEVVALLLGEAVSRVSGHTADFIEARSLYPSWADALGSAGFVRRGAYARWRLFPIQGALPLSPLPTGGEVRCWGRMSDLPILMELFKAAFSDHWDYLPPLRESWEEVVRGEQFDPALVLIAIEEGKPVGYAFGEPLPDPSGIKVEAAYLVSIGMRPGHQGRGWGGALLSRWLRAAYDTGLRAAELDVDSENRAAQSLYVRSGFRFLRSEHVWRLDLPGEAGAADRAALQRL